MEVEGGGFVDGRAVEFWGGCSKKRSMCRGWERDDVIGIRKLRLAVFANTRIAGMQTWK